MNLKKSLQNISKIRFLSDSKPVNKTVADELLMIVKSANIETIKNPKVKNEKGVFYISIGDEISFDDFKFNEVRQKVGKEFCYFRLMRMEAEKSLFQNHIIYTHSLLIF